MDDILIEENELVAVAMQIILNAGDARVEAEKAISAVKGNKFEEAKRYIKKAKECIRLAHNSQTEVIQNETRGAVYKPCLLFIHAQDTLMTIMSEVMLAEELIGLFEICESRFKDLESKFKDLESRETK